MKKQQKSKISISEIENLLVFKHLENSYKLFWFKAILDEVAVGKQKIYFLDLAKQMVAESWEMVFEKNRTLGRLDRVHHIAEEIEAKWHIGEKLSKEAVRSYLNDFNEKELSEIVADLYEETPYTFLEPMYEDKLNKRSINKRLPMIEALLNADEGAIYKVDSKQQCIVINQKWLAFFKKERRQIEAIWKDAMAYYLTRNAGERIK